jgi:hypothetical protein
VTNIASASGVNPASGKNESGVFVETIPLQDEGSAVRGEVSVVLRYVPNFWT